MSYRSPISWRRLRAASDTTLSRKGAKLPLFRGASERLEGLCSLVLGRTGFEIARDRNVLTISTNLFGTTYYSLVGLHAFFHTSKLREYYVLTKPEVNLLILMTTSTGYYLGDRGPLKIAGLVKTLVSTLLVASGTATLINGGNESGTVRCVEPLPALRLPEE